MQPSTNLDSATSTQDMALAFAALPDTPGKTQFFVAIGFEAQACCEQAASALASARGLAEKPIDVAAKKEEDILAALGVHVAGLSSSLRANISDSVDFSRSDLATLNIHFHDSQGQATLSIDGQDLLITEYPKGSQLNAMQVAEIFKLIQAKGKASKSAGASLLTVSGLAETPLEFQGAMLAKLASLQGFDKVFLSLDESQGDNIPVELAGSTVFRSKPDPAILIKNLTQRRVANAGEAQPSNGPI